MHCMHFMRNCLKCVCVVVGLSLVFAPLTAGAEMALVPTAWQGSDTLLYVGSFVLGVCLLYIRFALRHKTLRTRQ